MNSEERRYTKAEIINVLEREANIEKDYMETHSDPRDSGQYELGRLRCIQNLIRKIKGETSILDTTINNSNVLSGVSGG